MLYGIIRIVFFGLAFLFAFVFISSSKMIRKKMIIVVAMIMCVVLCSISFLMPIENLFIKFKSPEVVFNYSCNGKIEDIIYGHNSCLIFSSDAYNIILKTEAGYKISTVFSSKTVYDKFDKYGSFKVYNASNTNDFYIWGTMILKESTVNITDSNNSVLKTKITKNSNTNYYTALIYGFIDSFTNDYFLLINGEKILFTIKNE